MRRLGRWLLNTLTVLSLLLCVATIALWGRSFWRVDWAGTDDRPLIEAVSARGRLGVRCGRPLGLPSLSSVHVDRLDGFSFEEVWDSENRGARWGFAVFREDEDIRFMVPHWCLALVAGAFPTIRLIRIRRARRRWERGLCSRCSYDLTGNVSGVCPECGTPAGSPQA